LISPPSAEFARRSALYAHCDGKLFAHTRFFAAAATVNAALARRFNVLAAVHAPRSFRFLSEVGAALEVDNLKYARHIENRPLDGALDYALVRAEQRRLQEHVDAHRRHYPNEWQAIRRELNGVLNERYATSFLARFCEGADRLTRVLRQVRGHVRAKLDFADESHRIRIGLQLIDLIRHEERAAPEGRTEVRTTGPREQLQTLTR
jgi:hypothetical protein